MRFVLRSKLARFKWPIQICLQEFGAAYFVESRFEQQTRQQT
jgi:hypothetical protein